MRAGVPHFGGWAIAQMIEAMDRGVDALIPEASMVAVYSTIWDLHHAGRREEAVRLFRQLLPVVAFTNQEIRLCIAFFKRLLVRKGIFSGETMRLVGVRVGPSQPEDRRRIDRILPRVGGAGDRAI